MMPDITFARPSLLWLLIALPALTLVYLHAERARQFALKRLLAARLLPRLAGNVSVARRRTAFLLLLVGLGLCVMALAGPRWGLAYEETYARGRDIIIAMDTSRSMLAQDLTPSRLQRAKYAALDLIKEIGSDRVGLIAFAGEAFLQAPLTPDHEAIETSIRSMDTEVIGQGGTNLTAAIETAREAFGKGEGEHRALVLFSDGEELQEDALDAAKKYKDQFRIFTIGVGTEIGAPVLRPLSRGQGMEYVRDEGGNMVTTKLDEKRLQEVAKLSGGLYLRLQNGPADMRTLVQSGLAGMSDKELENKTREVPQERFQWPLLAGLSCLFVSILLGESRRVLVSRTVVALLLLSLGFPGPTQATTVGKRDIQPVAIQSTDPAPPSDSTGPAPAPTESAPPPPPTSPALTEWLKMKAARPNVPEIDYNLGCEAYKIGDYDTATKAFSDALGTGDPALKSKAAFNLGNTLFKRGVKAEKATKLADWENALEQYKHALSLSPENESARANSALVQKAITTLKQQEEEEKKLRPDKDGKEKMQQEQKQKDESGDGKKEDEKKSGKSQDGEEKDGQTSESQDGEKGGEQKKQKGDPSKEGQDVKPEQPTAEMPEGKDGDPDPKKDRTLKQAGQDSQDKNQQEKDQQEAAEAAQAAREGRMTDKDARALLQGMRKYDRILPLRTQQKVPIPGGKDW